MGSIFISAISLVVLIIISGFFAGAETAITGVSQATIHRLKLEGNHRAEIISILRKDKEKLISALLLGNTSCNTFASFLAAHIAEKLFTDEFDWICGIITACIIFIFAEVMPKSYAFENAEKMSLYTAPILYKIVKIVNPFVISVQLLVNYLLSKFTVNKKKASYSSVKEEIRGAIELHHHEGLVVKNDRDMLGGILDMKDIEVSSVMIHRSNIISINIDASIDEIINQAIISKHTRLPLWQNNPDNIVGILNIKDLLGTINEQKNDINAINIKSIATKPWFVPENSSLSEQLAEFRKKRNHLALVIDEYGALLGLITFEDIIEEIVGKIDDEHDIIREDIMLETDGSYKITGISSIRDVNRQLEWTLPTENATTIAGLIMNETGRVPKILEVLILHNVKFTILEKHYNQIKLVKAKLIK